MSDLKHHFLQNVTLQALSPSSPEQPGEPCLVFKGVTEHVYLPLSLIGWLEKEIQVLLNAHEAQSGLKVGKIEYSRSTAPQTWRTGTMDNGDVAVVIDHGLPTQQTFTMTRETALSFGQHLVTKASQEFARPSQH